jgi:hypothetical protein
VRIGLCCVLRVSKLGFGTKLGTRRSWFSIGGDIDDRPDCCLHNFYFGVDWL